MSINFQPDIGTILRTDFTQMRLVKPEMVKARMVTVVSPPRRYSLPIATVVPISTVEPDRIEPWHYQLPRGLTPFEPPLGKEHWVKCDMLYTLGFERLDRVWVKEGDSRDYTVHKLPDDVIEDSQNCIGHALSLNN